MTNVTLVCAGGGPACVVIISPEHEAAQERCWPGPGQQWGLLCTSDSGDLAGVTAWMGLCPFFSLLGSAFFLLNVNHLYAPFFHSGLLWLCPLSYKDSTLWPSGSWGPWGGFAIKVATHLPASHGSTIGGDSDLVQGGSANGSGLPPTTCHTPSLARLDVSSLFKVLRVNYDVYCLHLHSW